MGCDIHIYPEYERYPKQERRSWDTFGGPRQAKPSTETAILSKPLGRSRTQTEWWRVTER